MSGLVIVSIVLVAAVVLFVTEIVPYDVTALAVSVSLLASGVLTPSEALSGLSSPATVSIASMLVISAGLERTGALRTVTRGVERLAQDRPRLGLFVLLIAIGVFSGFVNNTAVVAVFIPVMMGLAPQLNMSPSRLLMPLSFVSILGGVCTVIGTSTNLLVSSIAVEHGAPAISMFELLPVAGIIFVVGFAYMWFVGTRLIPERRTTEDLTSQYALQTFVTDVRVLEGGFAEGRPIAEVVDRLSDLGIEVLGLVQDGDVVEYPMVVRAGNTLRVIGRAGEIDDLLNEEGLELAADRTWHDVDLELGDAMLVEAVLAADSDLEGQSLGSIDFPGRFSAQPLAARQRGRVRRNHLVPLVLHGGDSVLLRMAPADAQRLRDAQQFVVVSQLGGARGKSNKKVLVAVAILLVVVTLAWVESVPIVLATLLGGLAMVLTRCLTPEEGYGAVNFRIIILLAGVIPLGLAMEKTGLADLIVDVCLATVWEDASPQAVIAVFFILTALLTEVMSNVATASVMAPLAFQAASAVGMEARPLLLTVTMGASLSFMSPIGYQTNTLIYAPGQYQFSDFIRVGGILNLICLAIIVIFVPLIWPT